MLRPSPFTKEGLSYVKTFSIHQGGDSRVKSDYTQSPNIHLELV